MQYRGGCARVRPTERDAGGGACGSGALHGARGSAAPAKMALVPPTMYAALVAVWSVMMLPASLLALHSRVRGRAVMRPVPRRVPNQSLSRAAGAGDAGDGRMPRCRGPRRLAGGASAACRPPPSGSDAPSRIGRRLWGGPGWGRLVQPLSASGSRPTGRLSIRRVSATERAVRGGPDHPAVAGTRPSDRSQPDSCRRSHVRGRWRPVTAEGGGTNRSGGSVAAPGCRRDRLSPSAARSARPRRTSPD